MEDSQFENNAIALLRKDLKRVTFTQLESEFLYKDKLLKAEKERLDRLSSQLNLTKQQIDFFVQETSRAKDGIRSTANIFTRDLCSELTRLKNPSYLILNLCEKVLLLLDRKDRS